MKVSAYPPLLAADIAAGDLFLVVDVSANATKVITKAQLVTAVGGGGGGSGDMTQLVYDTDGDGVINLTSIPALPESRVTNLVSDLSAKAPLANPALTGTPTAPTAAPGTNTTQLATTAFATAAGGGTAIGGAVAGGTAGRVLFEGAGPVVADDARFTFDASTLTIGLYNTTGTDYERGFIRWTGNVLTIGTEVGGLGTARDITFSPASGAARVTGSLYVSSFLLAPNVATDQLFNYAGALLAIHHDNGVVFDGASPRIKMPTTTDPSAPAAGSGVFYFRTNGGGKMEFVVRFPTGAVQVISTEP